MAIDEAEFRTAMGHFASGVTVVTTRNGDETAGLTVSSFCSLSLEPPLVLICIDRDVSSHDLIRDGGRYAVNMLASEQEELSRRFASRMEDKFDGIGVRSGLGGVPLLEDALAVVECVVEEAVPGGDHTIFIGRVERAETSTKEPLVYFRSGYHFLK